MRILLILFFAMVFSGCSITSKALTTENYVSDKLTTKNTKTIASDMAHELIASYPEKNVNFKIPAYYDFGRQLAKILQKEGYSVASSYHKIYDTFIELTNEKKTGEYTALEVNYLLDKVEKNIYYASISIENDLKITKQYLKKEGKIKVLRGRSRGLNYE